jgi:hypothetical protein
VKLRIFEGFFEDMFSDLDGFLVVPHYLELEHREVPVKHNLF